MLGMRCGLYTTAAPESCLWNDKLMEDLNGTQGKSAAYFFNPEAPKNVVNEWKVEVEAIWMCIESKMTECGWTYVAGNTPMPADFQVLNFYTTYCMNDSKAPTFQYMYDMWTEIFKNCPKVKAAMDKLCLSEGIKMQLNMRDKSPF
jgi:hypothetical protein